MHVEQRLTTCEVCSRILAIQYHWSGPDIPLSPRERVVSRYFACPGCRHDNPMIVLLYAHTFQVKLVPGPEPEPRVRANTLRRLWLSMSDRVDSPSPTVSDGAAPGRMSALRARSMTTAGILWGLGLVLFVEGAIDACVAPPASAIPLFLLGSIFFLKARRATDAPRAVAWLGALLVLAASLATAVVLDGAANTALFWCTVALCTAFLFSGVLFRTRKPQHP
jgi:hypothetical protein